MSVNDAGVVLTLRSPLAGLSEITEDRIQWENDDFQPPQDKEPWLSVRFLSLGEIPASNGIDRVTGDFLVFVVVPKGTGDTDARRLASKIKGLYPKGSSIVGAEATVIVITSEVLRGAIFNSTSYAIPVSVTIRSEALRG